MALQGGERSLRALAERGDAPAAGDALQGISLLTYLGVVLLTALSLFRAFFVQALGAAFYAGAVIFLVVVTFAVLNALNLYELLRALGVPRAPGSATAVVAVLLLLGLYAVFHLLLQAFPFPFLPEHLASFLLAYTGSFFAVSFLVKQRLSLSSWQTALLASSWYVFSLVLLSLMHYFFLRPLAAGAA